MIIPQDLHYMSDRAVCGHACAGYADPGEEVGVAAAVLGNCLENIVRRIGRCYENLVDPVLLRALLPGVIAELIHYDWDISYED